MTTELLRTLYRLQETDFQMDALGRQQAQLEAQLGDSGVLEAMRAVLGQVTQVIQEMEGLQQQAEREVEQLADKITHLSQRLYDGSVRNPRELSDMQVDLGHLRSRRQDRENRVLELMLQLEEHRLHLHTQQGELAQMEQGQTQEVERLKKEQQQVLQELEALKTQRTALVQGVDGTTLVLYERLRKTQGGLAVARLEGGMCRGCRITLPTREAQRARLSSELVCCPSCGRILYVG